MPITGATAADYETQALTTPFGAVLAGIRFKGGDRGPRNDRGDYRGDRGGYRDDRGGGDRGDRGGYRDDRGGGRPRGGGSSYQDRPRKKSYSKFNGGYSGR